jgi:putative transposase
MGGVGPRRGMARKLRLEVAGGIHHVFARGVDRRTVFTDDLDRRKYHSLLAQVVRQRRWNCLAFCLLGNHLHLLLETPEPNLGLGMQRLHGDYVRYFNDRHERDGPLFRGRYGSVSITTDAQLWAVAAYIAANPVEAGLCAAPQDWQWGSHAHVVNGRGPGWLSTGRLFELLGCGGRPARYTTFVADAVRSAARAP